jgi:hypothetical protein
MSDVVKEKIAAEFKKAKEEGSLRTDRIREIVKVAVAEAVGEVKAGSAEIRGIAGSAIAAVIDLLKEKGGEVKAEVNASIEGVIDGIQASRQDGITQTQRQVDHLQSELDSQQQILDAEIDGALVTIETVARESEASSSVLQSLFEAAVQKIRASQQFAAAQEQYVKAREQLVALDAKLTERYGDRYQHVKHQLEKYLEVAKVWYEKAKTEIPDPVQKMHIELGAKMAEAGAAAARKEQAAKDRLKDILHKETQTHVSDAH